MQPTRDRGVVSNSFALAVLLFSLHGRRTGAMPAWQAWAGVIVAVLLLASFVAIPAILLPIWTVVLGLTGRSIRTVTAA